MKNRFSSDKVHSFLRGGNLMADTKLDDSIAIDAPSYNKHDLSHVVRCTAQMGQIMPVSYITTVPGDKIKCHLSNFARFNPLNKPILDDLETKMHAFYVPYRLITPCWELFITGGKDGKYNRNLPYIDFTQIQDEFDVLSCLVWCIVHHNTFDSVYGRYNADADFRQRVNNAAFGKGSMLDMLNLGVAKVDNETGDMSQTPLLLPIAPLLGYQFIWNDRCRVENYMYDYFYQPSNFHSEVNNAINGIYNPDAISFPEPNVPFGYMMQHFDAFYTGGVQNDIVVDANNFILRPKSTSYTIDDGELTGISFALACTAWLLAMRPIPADRDYFTTVLPKTQRGDIAQLTSMVKSTYELNANLSILTNDGLQHYLTSSNNFVQAGTQSRTDNVRALSTSITMNDLRQLSATTRFLEKNMLAGYTQFEQDLARFGISSKEFQFTRPQYLGGLKVDAVTSKVVSNADTENAAQTNGASLGTQSGNAEQFASGSFECECEDYGLIYILCSTAPKNSVANYIDKKHLMIFDRTALFTPEFAHLTEQPLYTGELKGRSTATLANFINGITEPTDADVLGYVPRYNEYRSIPSTVHGEYIPSMGTDEVFTTARDFRNELNPKSPQDLQYNSVEDPQCNRIFQVSQDMAPSINLECGFGISALRKIPRISMPMSL